MGERKASRRGDVCSILDRLADGHGLTSEQCDLLNRVCDRRGAHGTTNILSSHEFRGLWRAYYARPGGARSMRRSHQAHLRQLAAELDSETAMAAIEAVTARGDE